METLPLTVRRSIELVGLFVLGLIIVAGHGIITPIVMAFFLSILLMPAYRFLKRLKLPDTVSIIMCLLLVIAAMVLLVWFFSSQISGLLSDIPQIKKNVTIHLNSISEWINKKTDYTTERQVQIINEQSKKALDLAGQLASNAAASLSSVLVFVGLMPIYIFLLLSYKNLLLRFVFMWFNVEDHTEVEGAIKDTEAIIKSFLVGLLIQITYITVLLGGALMIFGIKHALLIGIIFAILNLIPYVGAFIGIIIGVLLTLSTSQEMGPVIYVLITIAVVQFLDNNILMPKIVGSKVKVNAFASIVGVIAGGSLAGVGGMFLSLPVLAIFKIIFDRTDKFQQWGVLLGDETPKESPLKNHVFRLKSKHVQTEIAKEDGIK